MKRPMIQMTTCSWMDVTLVPLDQYDRLMKLTQSPLFLREPLWFNSNPNVLKLEVAADRCSAKVYAQMPGVASILVKYKLKLDGERTKMTRMYQRIKVTPVKANVSVL